jgi:hypothetical protein
LTMRIFTGRHCGLSGGGAFWGAERSRARGLDRLDRRLRTQAGDEKLLVDCGICLCTYLLRGGSIEAGRQS